MLHFRYDILGLDPIHVYNGLKQLLSLTGRALSSLPCGIIMYVHAVIVVRVVATVPRMCLPLLTYWLYVIIRCHTWP